MDNHEILKILVDINEQTEISDDLLRQKLQDVHTNISKDVLEEIESDRNRVNLQEDVGWQYLHMVVYFVKNTSMTKSENELFTVDQFKVLKASIETIVCIGILPCLLPQIQVPATRFKSIKLKLQDTPVLEKYKIISYTTNSLVELFNNSIARAAIVSHLNCLLAALLQLAHAPLKKPGNDFEITVDFYNQLKEEQKIFHKNLLQVMENCPQPCLIKELMVILAMKTLPKWLHIAIKNYITERIVVPNGVMTLTNAICDEITDVGKSWNKLDVTGRLIVSSCNTSQYQDSICSQIVEMLKSSDVKQQIVAKCYIRIFYDCNQDLCKKKIIQVVMEPLLVKYDDNDGNNDSSETKVSESQVSECVQNLCKLFEDTTEFKCLPLTLLTPVSLPLFYLHMKSSKSIYVHRNQVRQLLIKLLTNESTRNMIFSAILEHEPLTADQVGIKLGFRFGVNGGMEIMSFCPEVDYQDVTDCLYNLVETDENLASGLFSYLLKVLPKLNEGSVQKDTVLETPTDVMEKIEKHLMAVKLLTLLSTIPKVQETLIKDAEPLLKFAKCFFSKLVTESDDTLAYEQDSGILYTILMLVKVILTERKIEKWKSFENFISSVKQEFDLKKLPAHVNKLVKELEDIVRQRSRNYSRVTSEDPNEFEQIFMDLADPLLPVRGHGIIALTKMIESNHPEVELKKDVLLCVLQENLEHEDSFIYLATINGLAALSTKFPGKILEILTQEFIGLTQQTKHSDITPDKRAKLGEILMKSTRNLGEVTPKYKSLLVNAFLCGTKDPDPLVRASSLSCLGEFCKVMGFRLGDLIIEILYCIGCIISTDKDDGCRRAGVLVATLLLRGLGKEALTELGENLVPLYRSLKQLRDNDRDSVLQLHAQLALEEFDDIVKNYLFAAPKLEKSIFLLS